MGGRLGGWVAGIYTHRNIQQTILSNLKTSETMQGWMICDRARRSIIHAARILRRNFISTKMFQATKIAGNYFTLPIAKDNEYCAVAVQFSSISFDRKLSHITNIQHQNVIIDLRQK